MGWLCWSVYQILSIKKKTNFSINQIDMNYEKPKQKIIIKFKTNE